MSEFFIWLAGIACAILILLIQITIHELGHYISGKALKFKIDEFSIGFGKAIFKKKLKNGELFAIRVLPLGGYCAFAGENDVETQSGEDQIQIDEKQKSSNSTENVKMIKIEKMQQVENNANKNAEINLESCVVCDSASYQDKVQNDFEPVKTNEEVSNCEKSVQKNYCSFNEQKVWKRLIVLFSGAFMNFLFAILLVIITFLGFGQFMLSVETVHQSTNIEYENYSFQKGDVILKFDGKDLYLSDDLSNALKGLKENDIVEAVVSNNGEVITRKIAIRKYVVETDVNGVKSEVEKIGLGISIGAINHKFDFWQSIGRSFIYCFKLVYETLLIPAKLIMGTVGINQIGGPITTIGVTAEFAMKGLQYLLEISAMIGISLAVFNLLPLPALDGSRMVFVAIEGIRKKPINRKVENYIHMAGLFLLFALVIIVDIMHFL